MNNPPHTIVMLTAGAGGMYCGSCIHDNTIAASLQSMGIDVMLVPTYTPIRTDEANVSIDRVFLGGINVYLQQKIPFFRYVPDIFVRWMDRPEFIRWATRRHFETDASRLGDLTISMLRGEHGRQRREFHRLCHWLKSSVQPALVVFSNLLIAGCAPLLRRELGVPILVTLQGDDVFLDQLPDVDRNAALAEMRRIADSVDGFLTHSRFYADYMAQYIGIARDRFDRIPLAVRTEEFVGESGGSPAAHDADRPLEIGYLARLAPEKGLHLLCDAFIQLRKRAKSSEPRLRIAGWLGNQHRQYAEGCLAKVRKQCGSDSVTYHGEVSRRGKIDFLRRVDIVSVPSPYREPKGIYVLESLAAGVPVVQPNHGAFPELIDETGGGLLFDANDVDGLAATLTRLLEDGDLRARLARTGQQSVRTRHDVIPAAIATRDVFQRFSRRASS